MTKLHRTSLPIANLFGAFGYIGVCVQWAWLAVTLVIPLLADSPAREVFAPPTPTNVPTAPPSVALPDFVQILLVAGAVIFAVSISIYIVIVTPKTVGKAGKAITQASAQVATKQLGKKRHYSHSAKRKLQLRISLAVKLALLATPLFALLIPATDQVSLDQSQIVIVGLIFGLASLFWFGLQYLLAWLAKISYQKLW